MTIAMMMTITMTMMTKPPYGRRSDVKRDLLIAIILRDMARIVVVVLLPMFDESEFDTYLHLFCSNN